ncbi:MAG: VOC family protein [Paracoccus sp. (in: a-proteobacteria)]
MNLPAFDHIVIAAERLTEGKSWLTGLLGITPEPGGRHEFMGAHNRLWRLGIRE